MRACIIPGSFDPFTLGHLDVVKRASALFDKVYVAIMVNSSKQGTFDFAKRKKIAELSCEGLQNVEIITADGLLADLCRALEVRAIVKGVRNSQDFIYEFNMAGMNKHLNDQAETLLLPCAPEFSFVSSTFVRDLIKYGKSLKGVMHDSAIEYIYELS